MLEGRRVRALLAARRRAASAPWPATTGAIVAARAVILATGGAAALWSRTTNPPGSYGSGLLLARAAGAELADLEFVQFHPTAVVGIPGREGFLISEAVRGEGATLHDAAGERFVDELQPRDAVARAIHRLLRRDRRAGRVPRHDARSTRRASPTSSPRCARPATTRRPSAIPVVAREPLRDGRDRHRTCTGAARSPGLYAVGECACTGLHGANRLASNSLSECFVFGHRAALAGLDEPAPPARAALAGRPTPISPRRRRARRARRCGATRGSSAPPTGCAGCSTTRIRWPGSSPRSALAREESRGAHARADFPASDPELDEPPQRRPGRRRDAGARQVDVSVRRLTSTQHTDVWDFTGPRKPPARGSIRTPRFSVS